MAYEVFEHTADLGVRIRAADLNTLFAEAGQALFSVIVANLEAVRPETSVRLRVPGRDLECLLQDWLSELLYIYESQRLILCDFSVSLDDDGLWAVASGEAVEPQRHKLDHEVKAITYHGLKVEKENQHWLAEAILDI